MSSSRAAEIRRRNAHLLSLASTMQSYLCAEMRGDSAAGHGRKLEGAFDEPTGCMDSVPRPFVRRAYSHWGRYPTPQRLSGKRWRTPTASNDPREADAPTAVCQTRATIYLPTFNSRRPCFPPAMLGRSSMIRALPDCGTTASGLFPLVPRACF